MFNGIVRMLTDVRHVPKLKNNLISLGVLDFGGYKYTGQGGALKVSKGSLVVMKDTKIGNLYKLEGSTEISEAMVVSKEASASTCLWHQRLGHMSKKGLQVLVNHKLLPNLQSLNFCKFYISVGYGDGVKGCRLWDPTSHKIIISRDMYMEQLEVVQDHKERFVCKLRESLYGLKVPRQWYKMFDSFMVSQNFLRSEYNHCVYFESLENGTFIILVLYVDDMLVASQSMVEINRLKAQLTRMFQMKDLGATKQILGIEVHRDRNNGKLWLSQQNSMEKILDEVQYEHCETGKYPLAFHCKLSSSLCPSSKEEKNYISHIPYASTVGRLMFVMECSRLDISHAVGVVSGHMENPGKEHWEWVLRYLRGTSITYSGCSVLVCGYVDSYLAGDLDKRRSTSGYVSHECKDLLGKFGQVQDKVFCGSQSVVHLTNNPTYQNGTRHHFVRQVTDGGGVVHTRANCVDMFTNQYC
jgi:hypothetical protein